MSPAEIMFTLSLFELMRAIFILLKWSGDGGEPEIILSRMNLSDLFKFRSRLLCFVLLFFTAQVMYWLPQSWSK